MKTFTRHDMIALDELLVRKYGLSIEKMMENAGRNLTRLVERRYPRAKQILAICGTGHNGGGVLVAARHLINHGKDVSVLLSGDSHSMKQLSREQAEILFRMGATISSSSSFGEETLRNALSRSDVILDGLLGYNVEGPPEREVDRLIRLMNEIQTATVSLDLPSGMDPDEGAIYAQTVIAQETLALGVPKTGLLLPGSEKYVGKVYLGDISIPLQWYQEVYNEAFFETGYLKLLELPKE